MCRRHGEALDGTTAYVRDNRGTVALDLTADDPDATARTVLPPWSRDDVLAAHGGVLALDPQRDGTSLGTSPADAEPLADDTTDTRIASFSPDGRYLTADADDLRVFSVATRQQTPVTAAGYDFAAGFGWIGEHTVVAIAARTTSSDPVLLTCAVPDGGCRVAATDIGSFAELDAGDVVLPVGTLPDS